MGTPMSSAPIAAVGDTVTWVSFEAEHREGVVEMVGNGSTGDRIYGVRLTGSGVYVHVRESRLAGMPEGALW